MAGLFLTSFKWKSGGWWWFIQINAWPATSHSDIDLQYSGMLWSDDTGQTPYSLACVDKLRPSIFFCSSRPDRKMYGNGNKPPILSKSDDKSQFLEQAKAAREERAHKQQQISAAVFIQVCSQVCWLHKHQKIVQRNNEDWGWGGSEINLVGF